MANTQGIANSFKSEVMLGTMVALSVTTQGVLQPLNDYGAYPRDPTPGYSEDHDITGQGSDDYRRHGDYGDEFDS